MKRKSTNNFLLALTAFIWGSAFVAQSVGMDYLGPFTFNSIRCLMGGIVLIPVLLLFKRNGRKKSQEQMAEVAGAGIGSRKDLIGGGICCGLALAAGSSLQQIGLVYTTAGKAGFIKALYI